MCKLTDAPVVKIVLLKRIDNMIKFDKYNDTRMTGGGCVSVCSCSDCCWAECDAAALCGSHLITFINTDMTRGRSSRLFN